MRSVARISHVHIPGRIYSNTIWIYDRPSPYPSEPHFVMNEYTVAIPTANGETDFVLAIIMSPCTPKVHFPGLIHNSIKRCIHTTLRGDTTIFIEIGPSTLQSLVRSMRMNNFVRNTPAIKPPMCAVNAIGISAKRTENSKYNL